MITMTAAATRLSLKQVSKINVVFNPFQWETAAAREFLRILDTESVKDSNPKCQIQSEVSSKSNKPHIEILFADKDILSLDAGKMNVRDILKQFNMKCQEKDEPS